MILLYADLECQLRPLIRRRKPHVAGLVLELILILGGEVIGRVFFYGLHMTVGMTIAGQQVGVGQPARFGMLGMTHFSQQDNFSAVTRVLGALFYYAPKNAEAASLVAVLTNDSWETQWPLPEASLAPLVTAFQTQNEKTHAQVWQRSLVDPWALPSPPWESVWLDRESVLFGDSALALRQWIRGKGIRFEMKQNEPEDHFGSLLLMVAWLAKNGRQTEYEELLVWHLFPRSTRFLDVLIEEAEYPFYRTLGELIRLTLAQQQSQLLIPVTVKPLFRQSRRIIAGW